MTLSPEQIMLLCFMLPLLGALIAATLWDDNIRDGLIIIIGLVLCVNVINLLMAYAHKKTSLWVVTELIPDVPIAFDVEPFGLIFALIASLLWAVTSLYSIGYMRGNKEKHLRRFSACFAIAIFAVMGIALAANMLTLFLFYEILTLCTFPLVTHHGTEEARRSGRIYLGILLCTSILLQLTAIVWTYVVAGNVTFREGGILEGNVTSAVCGILLFLYMYGIGKAALMPIHAWLPAAMVAPTPVSALLHAVAVVKAGVFTVVKVIVYIFGIDFLSDMIEQNWWAGGWLTYVAGATIVIASLVALRQDNLKKRLAYSTISQLSYVIMAASILTPKAIIAAVFHIAAHAFGKITLFFAAGAIYTASKKKQVSQLNGIAKHMPWTMAACSVGVISMIGLPPAAGFLSKYYMAWGALETGHYVAIMVIILSTLLNAAYFLPILYAAYFKTEELSTKKECHGEAPLTCIIAITLTASFTLLLFFFPDLFMKLGGLPVGGD